MLWLDGTLKDAPTVGKVIGAFKAWVTIVWRNYHTEANLPCLSHLWQRDYYEHVLRNAEDVLLTREYICNNPFKALMRQEQKDEEVKRTMRKRDTRRPYRSSKKHHPQHGRKAGARITRRGEMATRRRLERAIGDRSPC